MTINLIQEEESSNGVLKPAWKNVSIGEATSKGAIFLGRSPDTNKNMYLASRVAPLNYDGYSQAVSAYEAQNLGNVVRAPSNAEAYRIGEHIRSGLLKSVFGAHARFWTSTQEDDLQYAQGGWSYDVGSDQCDWLHKDRKASTVLILTKE